MLHKAIFTGIGFVLLSALGFTDEPPRPKQPQKQRVSPKVLKEALALPEFNGKPAEPPPVSLDDLKRVAEKLKNGGDTEDAELLQRFIHEHERPVKEASRDLHADQSFDIRYDVIEVNLADITPDSVLMQNKLDAAQDDSESKVKAVRAELNRLIHANKAKPTVNHVVISTRAREQSRFHDGGEFQIPVPAGDGKTREFGTTIDSTVIPISKDQVRLQFTCQISERDSNNSVTLQGVAVPGVSSRRIQSCVDVKLNETVVHSFPKLAPGKKLFVLTKVSPTE